MLFLHIRPPLDFVHPNRSSCCPILDPRCLGAPWCGGRRKSCLDKDLFYTTLSFIESLIQSLHVVKRDPVRKYTVEIIVDIEELHVKDQSTHNVGSNFLGIM